MKSINDFMLKQWIWFTVTYGSDLCVCWPTLSDFLRHPSTGGMGEWMAGIPCKGPCTASSGTWCRHCLRTTLRIPAPPGRQCCGWPEWSACAVDPWPSGEKEEKQEWQSIHWIICRKCYFLCIGVFLYSIFTKALIKQKNQYYIQPTNLLCIAQNDIFKVTPLYI